MVTLSVPDLVMLLVIVGFGAFGFALGLIQVVGSLVGMVAGAWLANLWYPALGSAIARYLPWGKSVVDNVAFVTIFLLVNRLFGLVLFVANRVLNLLKFIPFMKSLNRIGGGVLGLLEGVLMLGIVLEFASKLSPLPWVGTLLEQSVVAPLILAIVHLLTPFLPSVFTSVPSAPLPVNASPQVI